MDFSDFMKDFNLDGAILGNTIIRNYDEEHTRKMKELVDENTVFLYAKYYQSWKRH